METFKTQVDSKLDLTLYLEGLFQRDDEPESNNIIQVDETLETKLVENKLETNLPELSKIPEWGKIPFRCLLVKAAGLNFILPALSVSHIELINKKIIRIPLEVDAFQGIVTLRGKSTAVIDLFTLVTQTATNNAVKSAKITSHHVEYVMVMEDSSYALSCDSVSEMIMLNPDDIRWNKTANMSDLYSGIAKEYLCPLLNIDNINQQVSIMPFVQSLIQRND